MLGRLLKALMNRRNIAPELSKGAVCCVPNCTNPAAEQWMPNVCALREAGVSVDWVHVCAEHDVELNETMVRTIYGSKYDVHLAFYRRAMLGTTSKEANHER